MFGIGTLRGNSNIKQLEMVTVNILRVLPAAFEDIYKIDF